MATRRERCGAGLTNFPGNTPENSQRAQPHPTLSTLTSVSTDPQYFLPKPKISCTAPTLTTPWPTPWLVLQSLEGQKSKSSGSDGIPPWFIRLIAPFIAQPLSLLYHKSIIQSIVPYQWKGALITPIPKVPQPTKPADFRPISALPPLSTVLEKLVICGYLYPILNTAPLSTGLADQHAFRPTGSTTAAVISLLHTVTSMLESEPYVHVIALDFSKAFDVVRHSTLFSKLASLPIPDHIFGWLLDFFQNRSHRTKFNSSLSQSLEINSSVVQGSALGPVMFIINSSDLMSVVPGNVFVKYADDVYLLVPASNTSRIAEELAGIDHWCLTNNQKLNVSKSAELIMRRKGCRAPIDPPPTPGIGRVTSLLMLGVVIEKTLAFLPISLAPLAVRANPFMP